MAKNEATNTGKPSVVYNVVGQPVKKRIAKEASLWGSSPGHTSWLREGEHLLTDIGVDGQPVNQVDSVRAAWQPGTKWVYVHPTSQDDPNAIAVKRNGKRVTINLSAEMTRWQIALPVNTTSRFRLLLSTQEDPVYPAVKFDTGAPLETRTIKKKASGKANPSRETAAGQNPDGDTEQS